LTKTGGCQENKTCCFPANHDHVAKRKFKFQLTKSYLNKFSQFNKFKREHFDLKSGNSRVCDSEIHANRVIHLYREVFNKCPSPWHAC